MSEEVSKLFGLLAKLADAEGATPDDGSGIDGVWTTTVPSRDRDRNWNVAMNADTESERSVSGFPGEGDEASLRPGAATIWLGRWPAGTLSPFGGVLVVEQLDEPTSIEGELIEDVQARIDELEDGGELATDGGVGSDEADSDRKEQHRVDTIGRWDPPEADWAAEYDWTRYRGPDAYPCPGAWVLDEPEGLAYSWLWFPEIGEDYGTESSAFDDLEYSSIDTYREARAFLIGEDVAESLRDEEIEWTLSIDNVDVFVRRGLDQDELMGAVAEVLSRYPDDDWRDVTPTAGSPPPEVLRERELEQRREENESLDEFVMDGGQPDGELEQCPACGGSGRLPQHKAESPNTRCPTCHGRGEVSEDSELCSDGGADRPDGEIERVPFATQFLEPVIRGDKDGTVRIERYDVEAGDHIILTNESESVEWARAEVKYTVTCLAIEAGEILQLLDVEHALTNSDKHVREVLQPHYSEPVKNGDTVQILVWKVVQPFAEAPRIETNGGEAVDE